MKENLFALLTMAAAFMPAACGGDDDEPDPQLPAALTVSDQAVPAADVVQIDRAYAKSAGFIAIVQSVDGEASDPAIGVRGVDGGESLDLEVALERSAVNGERLFARMHEDSDNDGQLTWVPGGTVDPIVEVDGERLEADFTVTSTYSLTPIVLADDQPLLPTTGGDSQLTIKSVVTSTASFVIVQQPVSTTEPLIYGVAPINLGLNAVVDVALTATTTAPAPTETLEAVIHEDVDVNGTFDPAIDLPLLIEGDRVSAEFTLEAISTQ